MFFEKAKSVWLKELAGTTNTQARFECEFSADKDKEYTVNITAQTFYRLRLNGSFISYGPARGPHGYYRVDRIVLPVVSGKNKLSIEVSGYYESSFYSYKQPSFVIAELFENAISIRATDTKGDFKAYRIAARKQNVPRYSIQRGYMEIYDFSQADALNELDYIGMNWNLLERQLPPPGTAIYNNLSVSKGQLTKCPVINRNHHEVDSNNWIDYIDSTYCELWKNLELPDLQKGTILHHGTYPLTGGELLSCDLNRIKTGFIKLKASAREDTEFILIFDEKLLDGTIKPNEISMNNLISCKIVAGDTIDFESFECYSLRYLAIIVVKGKISISNIVLREYSMSDTIMKFDAGTDSLNKIYDAAVETLKQNTLDVFMDCPGRERAGWLCDSYFTAQTCYLLTGNISYERVFMENYAKAKYYDGLPEGMLPMCYPSDNGVNNSYIPQWAMWYVIELEEYLKRDLQADKMLFRDRCYGLWGFLKNYKNDDALLENLPGWNFIEWSQANDWMQDVHYPTNMLYSSMLRIIADIYNDSEAANEANMVKAQIMKQSFDGKFFIDNAIRNKTGELVVTDNRSEVCQYYAYFFRFACKDNHRFDYLTDVIINIFGPKRKSENIMPEIAYANAFIGNYLRLILLMRFGLYQQSLTEIELYFSKMAKLTGTLWENDSIRGSLNHGFSSFVAVIINHCITGLHKREKNKRS